MAEPADRADVRQGGVTTITRFAYDDGRQIWADLNSRNSLQMRYLRGRGRWNYWRVTGGVMARWFLTDRMGSIRNVTTRRDGARHHHLRWVRERAEREQPGQWRGLQVRWLPV